MPAGGRSGRAGAAGHRTTGRTTNLVPIEADRPENRANDVKTDTHGHCWVGTMAYDKRPGNAGLYRVSQAGVTRVVDGLTISNGPALDEAAGRLYLADTALGRWTALTWSPPPGH